jgi:hypothetical protein
MFLNVIGGPTDAACLVQISIARSIAGWAGAANGIVDARHHMSLISVLSAKPFCELALRDRHKRVEPADRN